MGKKHNVMQLLQDRERGVSSNLRQNLKILRELICQPDAQYQKIWQKCSNYPITYEGGKLYFDNFRSCYNICGALGKPCLLYQLPTCHAIKKIEDGLTCFAPLEKLPLSHKGYRPSFLAVTAHGWLIRYDMDSGEILQKAYLSSRFKFRNISWDADFCRLVIKSTHVKTPSHHRQAGQSTVLMAHALFDVFPLEFVSMFEVTRTVFGHDITDSMVSQGTLIVMHSGGLIRMYSIEWIHEKWKMFDVSLGEECVALSDVAGSHPCGLPLNVNIQERPPVLFEVCCADHNLTMGGIPWHYIISHRGNRGNFHVYSVETKRLAKNGQLDFHTLTVEPDKCFFHADDSGRILHIGANEFRVLKLQQNDDPTSNRCSVVEQIHIKAASQAAKPKNNSVSFSSSGRAIRRVPSQDDDVDLSYQCIQAVDHENELDMLAVTMATPAPDHESFVGRVCYHDNYTGSLLKEIPLQEPWNEFCDHVVAVDLDTVVHIAKDPYRKFICYVYRLHRPLECSNNETTVHKSRKSHHSVSRHRRRNRSTRARQRMPTAENSLNDEWSSESPANESTGQFRSARLNHSTSRSSQVNYREYDSEED